MNILFVGDEYPPFETGGLSQLCSDVACGIRARGHEVTVLCSVVKNFQKRQESGWVIRELITPISFESRLPIPLQQLVAPWRRHKSLKVFIQVLRKCNASIVVFWPNLYGDTHLMLEAEKFPGINVSYYVAGVSPDRTNLALYWRSNGKNSLSKLFKSVIRPFSTWDLKRIPLPVTDHVMCVSEFERKRMISEGLEPSKAVVVHNGIELDQFRFLGSPSQRRLPNGFLRVLYAGRLVETKGAVTIIQALDYLVRNHPDINCQVTFVGTGSNDYINMLKIECHTKSLDHLVTFEPWIERQKMPEFMSHFDILVLPTIHPEPLARVVQEAMALGLVVIATETGGTPEIIHHLDNGLLFSPADYKKLAEYLILCHDDINLCDRLAQNAFNLVRSEFTMDHMISAFESQLETWFDHK
jgi:glycogen synthase